jgi:hypothetical protein
MTNHVHVSALGFLITAAYVIILQFFWRLAAARWADRPIGKALAFLN